MREFFVAPDAIHPNRYLEFEVPRPAEWLDLAIELIEGVRHRIGSFIRE